MTAPTPMNLLWSYVYVQGGLDDFIDKLPVTKVRFFADCGAHSARTLGIALDIDSYGDWLAQWAPWMTVYSNLDVIWAPQATWDNQVRLEDRGLHPLPVFHTGEPFHWLERYLDAGYTYIALGKLLGTPTAKLRPWLTHAFRLARDRAVFHGFGMTKWQMLRDFPFYSVDSSSWVSGVRYGTCKLFHRGKWVQVRLRDRADVLEHREVLDSYRLPVAALSRKGYGDGGRPLVAGACAVANYRAAEWLRERHGPIELPPGRGYPPAGSATAGKVVPAAGADSGAVYLANTASTNHRWHAAGLHLYLADSSSTWTPLAAAAIEKETAG